MSGVDVGIVIHVELFFEAMIIHLNHGACQNSIMCKQNPLRHVLQGQWTTLTGTEGGGFTK
jgi:hypothetical protein